MGSTVSQGAPCGEVESVKAVSDVIAPLSGEVLEVNQKAVDEPEIVNEDPYGEGWLIRIRLSDAAEADALMDAEAYTALTSPSSERGGEQRLPLADRRRPRGDARGDRRLLGGRALRAGPPGVRLDRPLDLPPALGEAELARHVEELAARNVHTGAELSFLGRGSTTTTSPRWPTSCSRAASS